MRPRVVAAALCAAALLLVVAPAGASAWVARLHAPNHHPEANEPWKITVTAKRNNGNPLHAAALYKFLFNGQVVSTQYPSPHSGPKGPERHKPYHFYGKYTDRLYFPKRAIGIPLRLRVVVRAGPLGTKYIDFGVKVVP